MVYRETFLQIHMHLHQLIGSHTSKRTRRCTEFLDTRTSSIQRLQYQERTEWRKYWKDANHCFSTIMLFNWQDGCFYTFSRSWRNAKPFSGNAEPQQWAAKYLGHAWYIGKRFGKSNGVFFSTSFARVKSLGLFCIRTHITACDELKAKHQLRIRGASQDRQPEIHSSLVREDFQRIMGRPTATADFRSSL